MVRESCEAGLAGIHIRKGDHWRGRGGSQVEEKRKFIDEVTQRGLTARTALIGLGRQDLFGNAQRVAEEGDLLWFGFKIVEAEVRKYEIEQHETGADELERMTPAI